MVVHAGGQAGLAVGGIAWRSSPRSAACEAQIVADVARWRSGRPSPASAGPSARGRRAAWRRPRPPPPPGRRRRSAPGAFVFQQLARHLLVVGVVLGHQQAQACQALAPAPAAAARGCAAVARGRGASTTASNSIEAVTGLTRKPSSSDCRWAALGQHLAAMGGDHHHQRRERRPARARGCAGRVPTIRCRASASRQTRRRSVHPSGSPPSGPVPPRRWRAASTIQPRSASCVPAPRARWRCRRPRARAAARRGLAARPSSGRRHRQRDAEVKAAALARRAVELELAAHQPTRRWLIATPSPVPPKRRVVDASAWVKPLKMRAWFSGAMPMPVSRTAKRSVTWSTGRSHQHRAPPTSPAR